MLKLLQKSDTKTQELVKLALPIVMSLFLQLTYNIIDLYWVGRINSEAVAAIGSSVFFIHLGYSIFSIVAIGASVKIAQAVGAKDHVLKQSYVSASLILAILIGGLCIAGLFLFPNQCIALLDIESVAVNEMAVNYLKIIAFGMFFAFANNLYTSILNAHSLTKLSFMSVLIGNIANIILDPIFIFVLDMGVEGAAWATNVSLVLSFVYFQIIVNKRKLIDFKLEKYQQKTYASLVGVGSAGAIRHILFTLIAIAIGNIIASFGSEAIAAQKIGLQIEGLTFMLVIGISQGLGIMVGHAYGAKKYTDIKHLYLIALKIGALIAVPFTLLFLLLPHQLISLFVTDTATVEIGASYLIIVGISQVFMMMEIIAGGAFNGQGLTHYTAAISIVFTSLRIPLAIFLCTTSLGVAGIWWSISITSIIKGVVAVVLFNYKYKQLVAKQINNI